MKKMKQLILLTLCVFTLFGMTACAGKDKTDNAAVLPQPADGYGVPGSVSRGHPPFPGGGHISAKGL